MHFVTDVLSHGFVGEVWLLCCINGLLTLEMHRTSQPDDAEQNIINV